MKDRKASKYRNGYGGDYQREYKTEGCYKRTTRAALLTPKSHKNVGPKK